jgi:hypothetical protein
MKLNNSKYFSTITSPAFIFGQKLLKSYKLFNYFSF